VQTQEQIYITSAAMTPVELSKIIFTPLITIIFIAYTGTMPPICEDVRLYLMET
jgi:hypothetical protein